MSPDRNEVCCSWSFAVRLRGSILVGALASVVAMSALIAAPDPRAAGPKPARPLKARADVGKRMRGLPPDTPPQVREMIRRLLRRILRVPVQPNGPLAGHRIVVRSSLNQELDVVSLYTHVSTSHSRGFGGKAIAMIDALTDDSHSQQVSSPSDRLDLVVDVFVLPRKSTGERLLRDGEILRDAGGADNQGDKYRVVFRSATPCYVYIVQLDQTGRFYPLYPSQRFESGGALGRRVSPGLAYAVPPELYHEPRHFHLDSNRGDESVYFLASRTRRQDIEDLFRYFEAVNASVHVSSTRSLPSSARPICLRGPGGISHSKSGSPPSDTGRIDLGAAKWYRPERSDFLKTWWFRHE